MGVSCMVTISSNDVSAAAVQLPWKFDRETGLLLGCPIEGDLNATVLQFVLERALHAPQKRAIIAGGRYLTYQALVVWAERIASELRCSGAKSGSVVSVLAEPGAGMVAGIIGVMMAGCTYLPLDLSFSDDRIASVFEDAAVVCVVADAQGASRVRGLPVINLEEPCSSFADGDDFCSLPTVADSIPRETGSAKAAPAYVIYTSGSTGTPKGVKISHRNLAASTAARRMVYPGEPIFLMVSPLAFDSSVAGIWGTLTAGGTIVVASRDEMRDPAALIDLIADEGVTHLLCVPSLYRYLVGEAMTRKAGDIASLRCVIVAGEALDDVLVKRHFASPAGHACLVNEYGPTEATVWATYYVLQEVGEIAIGGPIPGAVLVVVDEIGQPITDGKVGELLIGGAGVSDGYLNAPLTDPSFLRVENTIGISDRFYRTGDQVRLNEDGLLSFVGRRDQQVKVRGHRIELLALESAVLEMHGVHKACALATENGDGLSIFVETEMELSDENLRAFIRQKMGEAYVPSSVAFLPSLPLSSTGKVDRQALEDIASQRATRPMPVTERLQKDNTIARVAKVWAKVLQRDDIPSTTNFFDLGGHSLLVFALQDELEQQFGRKPSAIDLFRSTTVVDQAKLFETDGLNTPCCGKCIRNL